MSQEVLLNDSELKYGSLGLNISAHISEAPNLSSPKLDYFTGLKYSDLYPISLPFMLPATSSLPLTVLQEGL